MRYPAQENPLDPVPQLEEDEELPDEPEEENSEIFLRVDVPAQCGHGGSSEA